MGQTIELTAADGHRIGAWQADPDGRPRGGIVVIQEIFGVNPHIRSVAESFAADGWTRHRAGPVRPGAAGHPARLRAGGHRGRQGSDGQDPARHRPDGRGRGDRGAEGDGPKGRGGRLLLGRDAGLGGRLQARRPGRGRQLTTAAACPAWPTSSRTARCSCISGSRTTPSRWTGWNGSGRRTRTCRSFTYPAGHGFSCDARGSYHAESARLARERTDRFLDEHLAGR